MKWFGVVLAGGSGERLFPISQGDRPKQLVEVEGKTLLQQTLDRMNPIIPKHMQFITTVEDQKDWYEDYPGIRLIEPEKKNTGASVIYSATAIHASYGEGIMGIFPSDHYVRPEDESIFQEKIREAYELAEATGEIVTLGFQPTYPSTGQGYMKPRGDRVEKFIEKPPQEWADLFYQSHLWNAGIYIGPIDTFMEECLAHYPSIPEHIVSGFTQHRLNEAYELLPEISIDKALAEKSDRLRVIPVDVEWSDVGNLDRFALMYPSDEDGNTMNGSHEVIEGSDNFLYSEDGMTITTIGVHDLLVIQNGKEIIVCERDEAEKVKYIERRGDG